MNVHKELLSAQKMQLVLIHLVHTSAAARMVTVEMASLVMVSNYFAPTLSLISDYFISKVFTRGSVSFSGLLISSFRLNCQPCQRLRDPHFWRLTTDYCRCKMYMYM